LSAVSGNSLLFSRWACRLTILHLFQPRDAPWDAPRWLFLHTLTFKDPEPDYREARRRWSNLRKEFQRSARYGVCVPEFGERTKRLHFHLVTSQRWDAREMWDICDRYGFGRYHVRRRPAWRKTPASGYAGQIHESAYYAAKYVGKRRHWPVELKGSRQWSVFGEKYFPIPPCQVRDVRITRKVLTVIQESCDEQLYGWSVWSWGPLITDSLRVKLRPDALSDSPTKMRELTKEQQAKVASLVAAGDIVGVGEYRVGTVETKKMESYTGGRPTGVKVDRVIVTHKIDFGAAYERREFDELMPAGTLAESVTFPAKSGDLVACCVDKIREFNGGTNYTGRVINLDAKPAAK